MSASTRRDDSSDALYAATGGRFLVDDVASLARISFRRNSAPLMSYSTLESSASSSASRPFHVRPARSIGGAAGVSAWVSRGERPRGEGFGGGVHRQQRRAFLVGARGIWRFLQPVPTRRRRAASMSADGGLGRAARGARGSTTIPSTTARRYLRPRPPHRALGTCGGASRTGNSHPMAEAGPRRPSARDARLGLLTSFFPASLATLSTNQKRSKSEADAESKVFVLLTF